jgi:hypothetical protein
MTRPAACCIAAIALAIPNSARSDEFSVTGIKSGDVVTATVVDERLIVAIQSRTGIGGATIARGESAWPAGVVLRLQYADGRAFKMLEGFTLTWGRMRITGGVGDDGECPLLLSDEKGNFPDDSNPAGRIKLGVKWGDEALELTLPDNLLLDSPKVEIKWIDAYRG